MDESQAEEREVLQSIFEGDLSFKEISPTCYQYKVTGDSQNESENHKAFILEITWPTDYPQELPGISLDTFFNKHLPSDLKNEIKVKILEQAEEMRDSAMTYSLFDWIRENSEEFINKIPDSVLKESEENTKCEKLIAKPKEKKENLTKAQKRRITERTNFRGERERGWDWVDVVKHLCQTGVQKD
eukprot:gene13846-15294_t